MGRFAVQWAYLKEGRRCQKLVSQSDDLTEAEGKAEAFHQDKIANPDSEFVHQQVTVQDAAEKVYYTAGQKPASN